MCHDWRLGLAIFFFRHCSLRLIPSQLLSDLCLFRSFSILLTWTKTFGLNLTFCTYIYIIRVSFWIEDIRYQVGTTALIESWRYIV